MRKFIVAAGLIASATAAAWAGQSLGPDEKYDPQVNPADFTTAITNPYSSMPIGRKLVYEQKTEDGLERIEKLVPGWTKTIMGVETLVSWHREYLDGELIEDVRDYYAQHKNGDVCLPYRSQWPHPKPLLLHRDNRHAEMDGCQDNFAIRSDVPIAFPPGGYTD